MKTFILIAVLLCLHALLHAQPNIQPALSATHTDQSIRIDGYLNDPAWGSANEATNFWVNFPADSTAARSQTRVRVLFDEQYLYVSAVMHHVVPVGRYIASSLRRDYPFAENDAFGVILDTYSDQTNGYGFYISAYGVQREEQIFSGGTADGTWDTRWYSAVSHDSLSWTAELAIPLRYVRYKEGTATWNVNFLRNDIATNERPSWTVSPKKKQSRSLNLAGYTQSN